ncbi:DUF6175 family protein [Lewinella cohaerens]|uniref:DUF6175 family protein n=1 Tax=Lewinella cohaerens TaxID=70995 RepID=UPI000368A6D5|nr:DUF6175 family protein [Lewinella cohaerens]
MRKYTLLLLFFYSCTQLVMAQTEPRLDSMPGYQPTIMVIPFAKQGEDWRQQLEQDKVMLTAVTAVREGFAAAGYSTVDLRARLRQLANDQTIEWGNLTSVKQEVIELSGADIYVEVEPIINESYNGSTGGLIMTAYDAVSGVSLANHTSHSPSFYTKQYERLVQRAAEEGLPEFIPQITSSFHDMLMAGRVLALNITLSPSVSYDLDSPVTGSDLLLAEVIANWLGENTLRGQYHLQGMTATKMIVDQLRVPYLHPTNGQPYRAYRFAVKLRNFLRELGYDCERDVQGNKIFITLN